MAEQEYERLQAFFFRSKGTVEITFPKEVLKEDIAGNVVELLVPALEERNSLNDELEILKLTTEKQETIICSVCGGKYSHFNKNRHYLTKKHLSFRPLVEEPPSQEDASP